MFKKYLEYSFSHVVLVPTAHQSESVACTHDSSFLGFLPVPVPTEHGAGFPELYGGFLLVIYFTHSISGVYQFSVSRFIPALLLFLLGVHTFVLCILYL